MHDAPHAPRIVRSAPPTTGLIFWLAILLGFAGLPAQALILLRIEGLTDGLGSSMIHGYEDNYISLTGLSFGVDRTLTEGPVGGSGDVILAIGKFKTLTLTKRLDRASTALLRKAIQGSAAGTAYLFFLEPDPREPGSLENLVVVMAYRLETTFVKSWSMVGDADARPTETVELWFNKVAMQTSLPEAGRFNLSTPATWDQVLGRPWNSGDLIDSNGQPTAR